MRPSWVTGTEVLTDSAPPFLFCFLLRFRFRFYDYCIQPSPVAVRINHFGAFVYTRDGDSSITI